MPEYQLYCFAQSGNAYPRFLDTLEIFLAQLLYQIFIKFVHMRNQSFNTG